MLGVRFPYLFRPILLFNFLLLRAQYIAQSHSTNVWPTSVTVLYGTTVNFSCSINYSDPDVSEGATLKDIYFSDGTDPFPAIYQKEYNESTLSITLENFKRGENYIYCVYNRTGVGRKNPISIRVGDLPAIPQNFNCSAPHWENLTCTYEHGPNALATNYSAYFRVLKGLRLVNVCSKQEKNSCSLNGTDYVNAKRNHTLVVYASNDLGNSTTSYVFDHYSVVHPPAPSVLEFVNRTTSSVTFTFEIGKTLPLFPEGLQVFIAYCSEYEPNNWTVEDTSSIILKDLHSYTYTINNMPYPGAIYDVRVNLRTFGSIYRSENVTGVFTTNSTIPAGPPDTTPGCFEIMQLNNNYKVVVYWKELKNFQKNAPSVFYAVDCLDSLGANCSKSLDQVSNSFAKFTLPHEDSYTFHIRSVNEKGSSLQFSTVNVPKFKVAADLRPKDPMLAHDVNKTSKVEWDTVRGFSFTPRYTVFYCKKDEKGGCQSSMNWQHSEPGQNSLIIKEEINQHIFGVSMQDELDQSSGIIWTTCTLRADSGEQTVQSLNFQPPSSRSVILEWQLGCIKRSDVGGYMIYYCVATHRNNISICISETKNITVNRSLTQYTLENLQPYTLYKVDIAIIHIYHGLPGLTKSRDIPTLPDVPDPPTDVKAINISHVQATISWIGPRHANSVLAKYVLRIHPSDVEIPPLYIKNDSHPTHYTIYGLKSSTDYVVTLQVCSGRAQCSNETKVEFKTDLFMPSIMKSTTVYINSSLIAELNWLRAEGLEMSNCHYEVLLRPKENDTNYSLHNFNCNETAGAIDVRDLCTDPDTDLLFNIRAVNMGPNVTLEGPFSEEVIGHCDRSSTPSTLMYIGVAGFFIFLVIVMNILIWRKNTAACLGIKPNFGVTLPEGLSPQPPGEQWPPPVRVETLPGPSNIENSSENENEQTPLQIKRLDEDDKEDVATTQRLSDCSEDVQISWEFGNGTPDFDYENEQEDSGVGSYTQVGITIKSSPQPGYVVFGNGDAIVPAISKQPGYVPNGIPEYSADQSINQTKAPAPAKTNGYILHKFIEPTSLKPGLQVESSFTTTANEPNTTEPEPDKYKSMLSNAATFDLVDHEVIVTPLPQTKRKNTGYLPHSSVFSAVK